jgi:hypothetical protein
LAVLVFDNDEEVLSIHYQRPNLSLQWRGLDMSLRHKNVLQKRCKKYFRHTSNWHIFLWLEEKEKIGENVGPTQFPQANRFSFVSGFMFNTDFRLDSGFTFSSRSNFGPNKVRRWRR